jgi:hypothetical protein
LLELKREMTQSLEGDDAGKRLRAHILKISEDSERELLAARKTITAQQKEIDRLVIDMEQMRQTDRK